MSCISRGGKLFVLARMSLNVHSCIATAVLFSIPLTIAAQQRDLQLEQIGGKRVALVIGNNSYPKWPLKNAVNDARAIGAALGTVGFEVRVLLDGDGKAIETAVDQFAAHIAPNDVALFYYAGHGVQIDGENYLIPVDFDGHDEADVRHTSLSASWVEGKLESTEPGSKSSFSMPAERTRSAASALSAVV
jgi:hypothetical protein